MRKRTACVHLAQRDHHRIDGRSDDQIREQDADRPARRQRRARAHEQTSADSAADLQGQTDRLDATHRNHLDVSGLEVATNLALPAALGEAGLASLDILDDQVGSWTDCRAVMVTPSFFSPFSSLLSPRGRWTFSNWRSSCGARSSAIVGERNQRVAKAIARVAHGELADNASR